MNFTQLQERVRLELLRRIDRGTLSVSLLARQTGLGQGHISNFLRSRRGLSLSTLDRILAAMRLEAADLLPSERVPQGAGSGAHGVVQVPLVSHATAAFEPYIRPSSVLEMLSLPADTVGAWRPRHTPPRKQWERLVAVRVGPEDGAAMEPVIGPRAVVVLDRHYNSFKPYTDGIEARANVYGVRVAGRLMLRFAEFKANRLVLRPWGVGFPLEMVALEAGETPNDLLVGRVAMVWNEM